MAPTAQRDCSSRPAPRKTLHLREPSTALHIREPASASHLCPPSTQPKVKRTATIRTKSNDAKTRKRTEVSKLLHQRMSDINECPYRILALRRNESKREDFDEILDNAYEDIIYDKTINEPRCKNIRKPTINWAVGVLDNEQLRNEHHSTARSRKCHCILAWERLTDPEQAFLIKHQDRYHRVPSLSNRNYDHSQDYPNEIGEPMTVEHEEFHDLYNRIWEKYDRKREDDDAPQPVDASIPDIHSENKSAFGSLKSLSPPSSVRLELLLGR